MAIACGLLQKAVITQSAENTEGFIGYWLLVIGYWLLVIGCWLLVVGCWLLVIGYYTIALLWG